MLQKQKKKMGASVRAGQRLLNGFGFTDRMGKSLKEDGELGKKTGEALEKLKRYQQEMEKPNPKTLTLQKQLNKSGQKYLDGKPLKEDGVFGPKTDYVQNAVDNAFTGWLMDDNYKERTLPTKVFPRMPKIGQGEVDKLVKGDWATLPDLTKKPDPGLMDKGLGKNPFFAVEKQSGSAFEKAYRTLEHKLDKGEEPFALKPGGQKPMERTLPGSYMGTQQEKDDISELQALIEEAVGQRQGGAQIENMIINRKSMHGSNLDTYKKSGIELLADQKESSDDSQTDNIPTTPEEIRAYLEAHPDATINGINAEKIGMIKKPDQTQQWEKVVEHDETPLYKIRGGEKQKIDFTEGRTSGTSYGNVVEEKDRVGGLDVLKTLDDTSGLDFLPLINEINGAERVGCEISEPVEINIEKKQNEANKENPVRKTINGVRGPIEVIDTIVGAIGDVKSGNPDEALFNNVASEEISKRINNSMDQWISSTDKKLTGRDVDGNESDKIFRKTVNVETERTFMGENNFHRYEIAYDYHVVDGQAKILSVSINDRTVADYYAYESNG